MKKERCEEEFSRTVKLRDDLVAQGVFNFPVRMYRVVQTVKSKNDIWQHESFMIGKHGTQEADMKHIKEGLEVNFYAINKILTWHKKPCELKGIKIELVKEA